MKNILLACGSGIATSTIVHNKIKDILDKNGFAGKYRITQCKVSEAVAKSSDYDFLIATTMPPQGLSCDFVSGICFLTGINTQPAINQILELMKI